MFLPKAEQTESNLWLHSCDAGWHNTWEKVDGEKVDMLSFVTGNQDDQRKYGLFVFARGCLNHAPHISMSHSVCSCCVSAYLFMFMPTLKTCLLLQSSHSASTINKT